MSVKTASRRSNPPSHAGQAIRSQGYQKQPPGSAYGQNPATMQQQVGNRGTQALLAGHGSAQPIQAKFTFGQPDDIYEKEANRVEENIVNQDNPLGQTFTEGKSTASKSKLTVSGRNFYQPHVGTAAHHANFHIGGNANELGKLAKAKALTFGNDVYIPNKNFAPETREGRALIGHELLHVGHSQESPTQIFRDEEEPHYPTAEEQKKIEKLLGRERKPTTVFTETVGEDGEKIEEETVVMTGKNLTNEERIALAAKLKDPLDRTIDKMITNFPQAAISYTDDELYSMAKKARKEIYEEFGSYISRSISLTKSDTSVAERIKNDEILVEFSDMSDASFALARTVASNSCVECGNSIAGLNSESKRAVVLKMAKIAVTARPEVWEKAAKLRVGGYYTHSNRSITMRYSGDNVYHSVVHELVHALAHPAFWAAFGDEDLANEGFTEYFARQVASGNSYPTQTRKVQNVKGATTGPFLFDFGTHGSAEESLRLAYFSGRLELIGWQPTSDAEAKAVKKAGGSEIWDPEKAKEYAETYEAAAKEKQDTHNNVLGVGIYFTPETAQDPTFTVRYVRILAQTSPYSRGRLLLEGQLIGSPVADPKIIGGSLGIAGEYQNPFFYAAGGARFIGGATTAGDSARVDFSPFVGLGIRAWQRIRVGGEGFVLLPILGEGVQVGGGATVSIEF